MARWITVRQPFDYPWSRSAISAFRAGEYFVKGEVADYAVANGFAVEGKTSQPESGKREVKEPAADDAADPGSASGVAGENLAADDRADLRGGVDSAPGER